MFLLDHQNNDVET